KKIGIRISREEISFYFKKFKLEKFRIKFLELLSKNNVKVAGQWPNGQLPNIDDDESSGRLAQLEEKWLGLD
ncbi:MAG: hypothetical protein AAF573_10190, partial [Bacteroidota bacterium]